MGERCSFRVEQGACLIAVPPSREILYGRMLRVMVRNLTKRFELFEYSLVKGQKELEATEDVVASVPLGGRASLLGGKQNILVFQRMHPSFYDENYVRLDPQDEEHFRTALQHGEEFIRADYTVSIPDDFFVAVVEDISMLARVMSHIKLDDFAAARAAVTKLAIANISIFDEQEMLVEYGEDDYVPEMLSAGLDAFMSPPQYVERLNI